MKTKINNVIDSEIIIYKYIDSKVKIEVKLQVDTVWLSQNEIAILFSTTK